MNNFYVYALLDTRFKVDESYTVDVHEIKFEYKPFYIGKGVKKRMYEHFSKSNLKDNNPRSKKILKIINEGYQPISIKLIENLTENDSYDLETKIISIIGLENLTNINSGGLGQSSENMMGEKNPMFGKKRPKWLIEKMQEERKKLTNKGKTYQEIYGEKKSNQIKKKMSERRKGKSWEEYFGKEKAERIKKERSILRTGTFHTDETKSKIKDKICTLENLSKRKEIIMKNRKDKFDDDLNVYRDKIVLMINNGLEDCEIIKRIENISRFRIKKMIYLIKNNLTSDFYFKIDEK